jgi:CubicO group peptidase (beta-lactamase class C family)
MRVARWILVCLLSAARVSAQPAQLQQGPQQSRAFDEAVERSRRVVADWQRDHHIPGSSVAVAMDGRVVWSEGFGWADLEQHVPVTPRTRFRIGSVSKMFAAVALMRLVEQGRIDLDAPIHQYVPDFPRKPWPISARQLAGHMSGIRHYRDGDFAPDAAVGRNRHFLTDRDALTIFEADPLEFEPGTACRYSTYGYSLLAAALGSAAGKPYQQVVHDLIAMPLGLRTVGADQPYAIVPDRSRFYVYRPDLGRTINAAFADNSYKWAGGGYLSSSDDLVLFASALTAPGLLSAASLDALFTPQKLADGSTAMSGGAPVGIGWRVDLDVKGRRRFHHGGSLTGGGAVVLTLRDQQVSVAIVTNQLPRPTEAMAQQIADGFAASR